MRFIHVLSACPPGWRAPDNMSVELMRLAVLSNVFPLYEVEDGQTLTQTVVPDETIPVEKYMHPQGRFKHLENKAIQAYQREVDSRLERMKQRFG